MGRAGVLTFGVIVVFSAVVAVMLKVLPGPHRPSDYMVVGTLATLACIGLVFIVLVRSEKNSGPSKRRKPDRVNGPDEPQ